MTTRSWKLVLVVSMSVANAPAWAQRAAPATGPHLVAPMTGSRATSHRPALHWAGGDGDVDLCRDRACNDRIATVSGHGGSAQPAADLATGRVFWRVRAGGATSPTWNFFVGARSATVDSSFGTTFDANGDGFADAIVRGADAVAIHAGAASGLGAHATTTVPAPREAVGFGYAVASAGDVNGDGYSDLLIGTFTSERAYVYLGGPNGIATTPAVSLRGPAGSMFGFSVAGAGDVNGDGYADVVVGAPNAGRAFVYHGGTSGVAANPAATLTPQGNPNHFGYAVAGVGDANGDGRAEIAVGALSNEMFVYNGGASGISSTPSVHLQSPAADFGATLASAGDVNGDGYADLLVGAMGSNATYVYSGSANGIVHEHPATVFAAANSYTGFAVAGVGDVNNDGFGDVVLATGGANAVVYAGSTNGLGTASPAATLTIPNAGEYSLEVMDAGDVNGDSFADVLVSTRNNSTTLAFLGGASGVSTTAAATLRGPAPTTQPIGPATPLPNADRDNE